MFYLIKNVYLYESIIWFYVVYVVQMKHFDLILLVQNSSVSTFVLHYAVFQHFTLNIYN